MLRPKLLNARANHEITPHILRFWPCPCKNPTALPDRLATRSSLQQNLRRGTPFWLHNNTGKFVKINSVAAIPRGHQGNGIGTTLQQQPDVSGLTPLIINDTTALIVDGTNVLMQSRADAGWGVSHVDAFTAWLQALRRLTGAQQLFVVFDNKRGGRAVVDAGGGAGAGGRGGGRAGVGAGAGAAKMVVGVAAAPTTVAELRRTFVPTYLDKRHAKQQQQNKGVEGGVPHTPARQAGAGLGSLTGGGRGHIGHPQQQPHLVAAEALMDSPPSHLVPFVAAVRQAGGLAMYGMPGLEADDLIASLVEGLLPGGRQQLGERQAVGAAGRGKSEEEEQMQMQRRQGYTSSTVTDAATRGASRASGASTTAADQAATSAAAVGSVVIASADSDMLQLLAHPRAAWLELRQLSRAASAQEPPPLAVTSGPPPLLRLPPGAAAAAAASALLRLHRAADALATPAVAPTGPLPTVTSTDTAAVAAATEAVAAADSAGLLPAGAYPDWLALVGKAEAGVPGVGVNGRSARKLLLRYGSLDGVVRAYGAGELDDGLRLTPAGNVAASRAASRVADIEQGGGSSNSGASSCSDSSGGVAGVEVRSPALRQALRNIQVTRMHVDPATVPWARVRAYQQEQHQQQLAAAALTCTGSSISGPPDGVNGGGTHLGPAVLAAPPPPPLHPLDELHAASAAPFTAALAAALRARGLSGRTHQVDGQGRLMDIVVTQDADGGDGAGCSAGNTKPVSGSGSGPGQPAEVVVAALAALVHGNGSRSSSSSSIIGGDSSSGRTSSSSSSSSDGVGGGSTGGGTDRPGAAVPLLSVCVLGPWDFETRPVKQSKHQAQKQQRTKQQGSEQAAKQHPPQAQQAPSDTAAARPSAPSARLSDADVAKEKLLAFGESLQQAAGSRRSLVHTPTALQALLRPTSAWRLKALQRGGGGRGEVAVVAFFELMEHQ